MQIAIREHVIRIQIIELSGRLEAATIGSLREAQERLLQAGEQNFILNLRRVSFMDSAGMAVLVSLLKRAKQAGGGVVLVKPADEAAYRVLTLTRFDQVFMMQDTVEDALKVF